MKETLIVFETAKIAFEKGFSEHCDEWFTETTEHSIEDRHTGDEILFEYVPPRPLKKRHNSEHENSICPAPTQSLLQKWLRELHDIDISISAGVEDGYYYTLYLHRECMDDSEIKWDTYEESLEKAIQQGLLLVR